MLMQISNLEKNIHLVFSRFIQSQINATLYTLDITPDLRIQIYVFLRESLNLCLQWKLQIPWVVTEILNTFILFSPITKGLISIF